MVKKIISVIILLLGLIPWNNLFGITIFTEFHTWLMGLKLGDVNSTDKTTTYGAIRYALDYFTEKYPNAKKFKDYREILDKMGKDMPLQMIYIDQRDT